MALITWQEELILEYMDESQMATQVSLSEGDRGSDTDRRRGGNVTPEVDNEGT